MPFKKGQSGNPKGRPRVAESEELRHAIKVVEKRKKKKFLISIIERAYDDNKLAVAVLNKIAPSLKHIDNNVEGHLSGQIALTWKNKSSK